MLFLRNLINYPLIMTATFIISSMSFLSGLIFGPFHKYTDLLVHNWGKFLLFVPGIKIDLRGFENLKSIENGCVVIVNHQSNFDIPIIFAVIPRTIRFMAKKSLFKIPVFGHALKAVGMIPIDRDRGKDAIKEMDRSKKYLASGVYFTVFPEGTRSLDNNIKGFKKGGFVFAIKNQAPILPVVISGSFDAMPKQSWLVRPIKVIVEFLPAIETTNNRLADRGKLLEETRNTMIEHHTRNIRELGYEL